MRFSILLREYEKGFHDFGRLGAFFFLLITLLVDPICSGKLGTSLPGCQR